MSQISGRYIQLNVFSGPYVGFWEDMKISVFSVSKVKTFFFQLMKTQEGRSSLDMEIKC